ncbi:F-box protein SKIP2 isoform X2 [Castanea sativa]|uniref:F-box protein SKIP2 isoform X2 n=1 Tax=Castanea sativa TaxID=21020 RepID=UPI003F6513A6
MTSEVKQQPLAIDVDLPEECWELIFYLLLDHHRHFESLSLVSKHFLVITNQLRTTLTVSDQTTPFLPRLLRRFQHLRNLDFCGFHGDLESILCLIAKSKLDLEALNISNQKNLHLNGLHILGSNMKNLKSLYCSKVSFLQDIHLFVIAASFPRLEELDISYPEHKNIFSSTGSNDSGTFSGPVTDLGVSELSSRLNNLIKIDLSDELLISIVEACLPLNKLILARCHGFTFAGLLLLLSKYHSLSLISIEGMNFLTDQNINELSKFFSKLTSINLGLCSKLTNSTFFTLTRNCPLLNEINMERTNLGKEECPTKFVVNPQVKSLNLAQNGKLSNESIKKFVAICPNLQVLNLSSCRGITEEGFEEIFKRCSEIRHLEINYFSAITDFEIDSEVSKLEKLSAKGSGLNDEALAMVGKRSCRLSILDLAGCLNVTEKGVKEVVKNCRGLREINLKWCDNVNIDIVAWMVITRPSLRKIIPPCGFVPTESQMKLFLSHGCCVCEG